MAIEELINTAVNNLPTYGYHCVGPAATGVYAAGQPDVNAKPRM